MIKIFSIIITGTITLVAITSLTFAGFWLSGSISGNDVLIQLPWFNYVEETVEDPVSKELKVVVEIDKNNNGIGDKKETGNKFLNF